MWNAGLDASQVGIKIAGRNTDNFRYTDDTTLMDGRKWRGTKEPFVEGEEAGLKLNIQKTKIMVSSPITSWQIEGKKVTVYFLGLQNYCRWWLQPWN